MTHTNATHNLRLIRMLISQEAWEGERERERELEGIVFCIFVILYNFSFQFLKYLKTVYILAHTPKPYTLY